jgi:hypothetical protein
VATASAPSGLPRTQKEALATLRGMFRFPPARGDPNFAEWKDSVEKLLMDVEQGELGPPSGGSAAGGSEARSLGAPRESYLLEGEGRTGGLGREEGPRDGPTRGPFLRKA